MVSFNSTWIHHGELSFGLIPVLSKPRTGESFHFRRRRRRLHQCSELSVLESMLSDCSILHIHTRIEVLLKVADIGSERVRGFPRVRSQNSSEFGPQAPRGALGTSGCWASPELPVGRVGLPACACESLVGPFSVSMGNVPASDACAIPISGLQHACGMSGCQVSKKSSYHESRE